MTSQATLVLAGHHPETVPLAERPIARHDSVGRFTCVDVRRRVRRERLAARNGHRTTLFANLA